MSWRIFVVDQISWKQVLEESHRVFYHNRPDDDIVAKVSVALFQEIVLSGGLSASEAFYILSEQEVIADFVRDADVLVTGKQQSSIERNQKLTNLE